VGTHFFFGLHELFGHGEIVKVKAVVTYPDGADGVHAESTVSGEMVLTSGLVLGLSVKTDVANADADRYELELNGASGDALELYGFTSLRRINGGGGASEGSGGGKGGEVLVEDASYGRTESVTSLVAAIHGADEGGEGAGEGVGDIGGVVSAREGRNAQRLLDAVVQSGGEWITIDYN
jgi:predicted dehydrogenase